MEEKPYRVAVIAGGAQGIGLFTAQVLLKNRWKVVIADVDVDAGLEAFSHLTVFGDCLFQKCDISNETEVQLLISKTIDTYRCIDLLINNAAISNNKPIEELSLNEWNKVIGVNLTGALLCTKYAAPYLRKSKGSVINLCSTRAFMSEKNTEAYSASKGGIYSLTHALAVSLGPDVRVNSISPGWIEVSELKKEGDRHSPVLTDSDHSQHPAGRVGNAGDVASMILFLASPENSFITGQNFVVDGGMTKKMIYI